MDSDGMRRVLQAARALLRWDAVRFAVGVGVAAVTIRRIEAGVAVKADTITKIVSQFEKIGIRVIEDDAGIVLGVGLLPHAEVGPPPLASAHARESSRQRAPRRPPAETEAKNGKPDGG